MNSVKQLARLGCLAAPFMLGLAVPVLAEPATDTKSSATETKKPAMSEADKRARAADCSRQANEKGLHGEARETFRAACKRK